MNDWSKSSLKNILNGTFLNSINVTYKNMIDSNYVWNLGGTQNLESSLTRENFYISERGTEVSSGRPTTWIGSIGLMYVSDYAYSTNGLDSVRDGPITSDWGNSADCRDNGWLEIFGNSQWTLSPMVQGGKHVFITRWVVNRKLTGAVASVRPSSS